MSAPANIARLSPQDIEQARQTAWDRFIKDYLGMVDEDPGSARARYWAEMASIDALAGGRG